MYALLVCVINIDIYIYLFVKSKMMRQSAFSHYTILWESPQKLVELGRHGGHGGQNGQRLFVTWYY